MSDASGATSELPFEVPTELLNGLGEGITLANRDGRIVFSNLAADHILGVKATESPPEQWAAHYGVFLPDGETPFPAQQYPLVRALAGESTDNVEMFIRNPKVPEGALISVTGRPLLGSQGEIAGASVVFSDITDLRAVQNELQATNDQLREAQRLKDELAAFVVHDLKSPVTAILLSAETLTLEASTDGETLEILTTITESARTLNRMILELLDVRMAEEGRLTLDLQEVSVLEVYGEIAQALRYRAESSGQEIEVSGDAGGLTVLADREYLRRVVQNLVENGLKYAPQGVIKLGARRAQSGVACLEVSDNGPGVPPGLRERIFDMYSKVERHEGKRHRDSRGLGLRFCRLAVEAHGGRIWVEDNEPEGTRFCVEVPIA